MNDHFLTLTDAAYNTKKLRWTILREPDLWAFIKSNTPHILDDSPASLSERLFCIKHCITEQPVCKTCQQPTTFQKTGKTAGRYNEYCCVLCSAKHIDVKEKRQSTMLEKFGVEEAFCSPQIKERIQQTMCEKYGSAVPLRNVDIKQKTKETNFRRYGKRHPRALTATEFIEKAKQVHADRYDYSNTQYVDSLTKVTVMCNLHGMYAQLPTAHLSGQGCPKCSKTVSRAEKEWLDSLNVPDTKANRQVWIKTINTRYKVDGFIPETNTVYEFWGNFWHGKQSRYSKYTLTDIHPVTKKTFADMYEKTQQKRQDILDAGYNLVEIWLSDWKSK